jgi:hypothetical protein
VVKYQGFTEKERLWSIGVLESWSVGATRLRICPSDSHPSGGFPVWECGMRNADFGLQFEVSDLEFIFSNPKFPLLQICRFVEAPSPIFTTLEQESP